MFTRKDLIRRQHSSIVDKMTQEIVTLKNAIKKHRDQKGDDRCWMDDDELYSVLNEPLFARPMPSRDKMMKNCEKFIALRTKPDEKIDDESVQGRWVSRAELEEQEKRLNI